MLRFAWLLFSLGAVQGVLVLRATPRLWEIGANGSFHDAGGAGQGLSPVEPSLASVPGDTNKLDTPRPTKQSILAPLTGSKGYSNSADVSQVKFNKVGDSRAVSSSLMFGTVATIVMIVTFTAVRRWNAPVYAREELVDSGEVWQQPTNWISHTLAVDADREVWEAGLDGWSLLECYRFHRRMLVVIGPPILLVLCPVQWLTSKGDTDKKSDSREWLSRLDIGNIGMQQEFLWLYAALVWFVIIAVTWLLHDVHQEFLERRFAWLKSIASPQATTVLLENIPHHLRTDNALADYFQGSKGVFMRDSHIVQRSYIVRRTKKLQVLWEAMQATQQALDVATHRTEGAGAAPESVLGPLRETLEHQQEAVEQEQRLIENGVANRDLKICAPSAFVTFTSTIWQRLALKEHFRADRTELVASFPPDPHDVMYENLMDNAVRSFTWFCLGWLCLVGIFLFWSPLVVFISSWTTLPTIRQSVPAADQLLSAMARVFPWFPQFLEGVLATAALRFFLAFLPAILLGIIRTFFPVKAGAMAQVRLGRWYFSFLLIFVLLVTTLGRGIIVTAVNVARDPSEVISLLSTWLPQSSHFYFHYMIFGWTTISYELFRTSNLLKYWFYRIFHKCQAEEAKRQCEPENQASFGMGSRMGVTALMSSITLVFCICSPLILPFALVYFSLGRVVYGFLLVHVEEKKPDTGGLFWVECVHQTFFNLALLVLLMTGVLAGQEQTYRSAPAACALSSGLVLYAMWYKIKSFEWETLPLEHMSHAYQARERAFSERAQIGEYRQRECGPVKPCSPR